MNSENKNKFLSAEEQKELTKHTQKFKEIAILSSDFIIEKVHDVAVTEELNSRQENAAIISIVEAMRMSLKTTMLKFGIRIREEELEKIRRREY